MLTQAWVNDAAYFDGTGFAEITFADTSATMQRFEQEVKLLSHSGVLLLLQNGVNNQSLQDFNLRFKFVLSAERMAFSYFGARVLLQNQFLCLAVLQGRLKVFYDFRGNLVELEPKDPSSNYLKISDADQKNVSPLRWREMCSKIRKAGVYRRKLLKIERGRMCCF